MHNFIYTSPLKKSEIIPQDKTNHVAIAVQLRKVYLLVDKIKELAQKIGIILQQPKSEQFSLRALSANHEYILHTLHSINTTHSQLVISLQQYVQCVQNNKNKAFEYTATKRNKQFTTSEKDRQIVKLKCQNQCIKEQIKSWNKDMTQLKKQLIRNNQVLSLSCRPLPLQHIIKQSQVSCRPLQQKIYQLEQKLIEKVKTISYLQGKFKQLNQSHQNKIQKLRQIDLEKVIFETDVQKKHKQRIRKLLIQINQKDLYIEEFQQRHIQDIRTLSQLEQQCQRQKQLMKEAIEDHGRQDFLISQLQRRIQLIAKQRYSLQTQLNNNRAMLHKQININRDRFIL